MPWPTCPACPRRSRAASTTSRRSAASKKKSSAGSTAGTRLRRAGLRSHPLPDLLGQKRQRYCAVLEDAVVEALDVEFRPKLLLRAHASLLNLEHAQHVCRRLSWIDDVPIDLRCRIVLRLGCMGEHVVDRLLSRPSLRMESGVHD